MKRERRGETQAYTHLCLFRDVICQDAECEYLLADSSEKLQCATSGKQVSTDITSCRAGSVIVNMIHVLYIQRNLSIKDTLNMGDLSNEGTVCNPNQIEL